MTDEDLRRIVPPRAVEVLHDDGQWVAGAQGAWVRWHDGRWRAAVSYSVQ